jgi:hypothetical protein
MKIHINFDKICLGLLLAATVGAAMVDNYLGTLGFASAVLLQVGNMKLGGVIAWALYYNQLLRAFYTAHKGQLPPDMPQEQVDKFKQLMGE